jgi:hypothetical protein
VPYAVLPEFFLKREKLIGDLQRTARKVNDWWAERESTEPTLHDLAMLEGLLSERKTLLERMMRLDDDMLGRLVKARSDHAS